MDLCKRFSKLLAIIEYSALTKKFLTEAFHDAAKGPFGYLNLDLKPSTDDKFRVQTGIFLNDIPVEYSLYRIELYSAPLKMTRKFYEAIRSFSRCKSTIKHGLLYLVKSIYIVYIDLLHIFKLFLSMLIIVSEKWCFCDLVPSRPHVSLDFNLSVVVFVIIRTSMCEDVQICEDLYKSVLICTDLCRSVPCCMSLC